MFSALKVLHLFHFLVYCVFYTTVMCCVCIVFKIKYKQYTNFTKSVSNFRGPLASSCILLASSVIGLCGIRLESNFSVIGMCQGDKNGLCRHFLYAILVRTLASLMSGTSCCRVGAIYRSHYLRLFKYGNVFEDCISFD
jgi:hypothetical protein